MANGVEDRWTSPDGSPSPRHGRGLRWRVRWRDPNGKHRNRSFARKDDAERFLVEVRGRLNRGDYLDPNRGRSTVSDVADSWWAAHSHTLAVSTATRYRGILDGRIAAAFGSTPVAAVDYAAISEWAASLSAEGLAGSSVRQHLIVLAEVLDHAVRDRRIPANPARLVSKPRSTPRRRHRYLDAGQLFALADACGHYRPLVITFGICGLRWGEAAALRPEDVDVARGRLHIDRAVTRKGSELIYHSPKTHQRREVPVPDLVLELLADLEPHDGLLFTSARGRPLHHTNFRRQVFTPALDAVGLPEMRIHELRHTAASLAVSSGADVLAVSRMLGHANPAMTLKVYADLFDRDLDDVRSRMDRVARAAASARGEVVELAARRASK